MRRALFTGLLIVLSMLVATTSLAPTVQAQSGSRTLVGFVFDRAEITMLMLYGLWKSPRLSRDL